jgi:hypothetical protein
MNPVELGDQERPSEIAGEEVRVWMKISQLDERFDIIERRLQKIEHLLRGLR